ncbi:MAG TPA: DUF192 domain-containing protein [Tepidisphaeraceae bacterium]|nr:DUF192 domain-containing protein [Tepidisphaeraceae bacterium]
MTALCKFCLPALLWLLLLTGCNDAAPTALPTVPVRIGQQTFQLEIANDDAERQQGLMHRDSMPPNHGMIFVFPDERERAFWMKNTKIPLDILYLDSVGTIVSIRQLKPFDETSISSWFPARFAIELNEGAADKSGVRVGHVVKIPAVAREVE